MLKESYSIFQNDLKTYVCTWTAEQTDIVLLLVHGLGEHIRRYDDQFAYFNKHNITVIGADLIGHGRSEGTRGHWSHIQDQYKIVDGLFKSIPNEFKNKPVILYGHSMGGNIAAGYTLNRKPKLNGLILTGSAIKTPKDMPEFIVNTVLLLPEFFRNIIIKSNLDLKSLCSDKSIVDQYTSDPLVHDKIGLGAGATVLNNAQTILNTTPINSSTPTLIMHGGDDKICLPNGSELLTKVFSNNTLKIWPGMLHEIHNEKEKIKVWDMMVSWIVKIKE